MITGLHAILYSTDADATRAFLRDVLQLPSVDAGGGWLIFASPPAELAAHPTDSPSDPTRHQLFLMCDDINAAVEALKGRGVEVTAPVSDQGWGLLTSIRIPGAGEVGLYEPRHPRPKAAGGTGGAKPAARKRAAFRPARKNPPSKRKPTSTKQPAKKKPVLKKPARRTRRR